MPDDLLIENVFDPPITTDPAEIREEAFARMQARMPLFVPRPTSPLTQTISAWSEVSAEMRQAFVAGVRRHLLEMLGSYHGIPRILGAPARGTVTLRAIDRLGHELAAGTTAYLGDVQLETAVDLVIAPGADSARVLVQTIEPGTAANGADGPIELDALDWLADDGITLDAPLANGIDPETETAFGVRVAEELGLLTRAPILAANFSVVARRHPRVGHAWVIDLYDPEQDPPTGHVRHVAVVVTDILGGPLDEVDLIDIQAMIAATRETTYFIHVLSPDYVTTDAQVEVIAHRGWDLIQVAAATRARLTQVLSPAPWILPPYGLDPGHVPTRLVHRNELVAQADRVLGVDIASRVVIGDGRSDSLSLGPLQLPTPGTITVRAVAPDEE